jgi:hypothetical protein
LSLLASLATFIRVQPAGCENPPIVARRSAPYG